MSDLISRQAAIDALHVEEELLKRVLDDMDVVGQDREKYSWGLGLIESYISDIEELPSAEPKMTKQEVLNYLDNVLHPIVSPDNWNVYSELHDMIEELPSAEPVRHGKWKWLSCTYDRVPREKEYECSECHHKTIVHGDDMPWEKYCPNCGADMRGEE